MDEDDRFCALQSQVQGTRAVRQNRELGLAKTRGWGPQGLEGGGNLGVHPSLWLIARPGRAASGPGHAHIMLRCFPGVHACLDPPGMQIFVCCESLEVGRAEAQTLDRFYCGIQALRSRSKSPGPGWKGQDRRFQSGAWAKCG